MVSWQLGYAQAARRPINVSGCWAVRAATEHCSFTGILFPSFLIFFLLHIFSVAPSNFSDAYSTLYAPYLVFRSQIRRKEMQKGQVGYGIALRRFCGLRVNVLHPSGAKRFNILSSRTVILFVPVLLFTVSECRWKWSHYTWQTGKYCVWLRPQL